MILECINNKYNNSRESNFNEIDNEVIKYLTTLGYSVDIIGVSYFKDMIISIIEKILSFNSVEEIKSLFEEIENPYSQFYFDLARNKYDMGITTYNEYIRKSFSFQENENTGLKAYQFALKILQGKNIEINLIPFVRKLNK